MSHQKGCIRFMDEALPNVMLISPNNNGHAPNWSRACSVILIFDLLHGSNKT